MNRFDRRTWITLGIAAVTVFIVAFAVGRWTAPSESAADTVADAPTEESDTTVTAGQSDDPTSTTETPSLTGADPSAALVEDDVDRPSELPPFGSEEDREALLQGLAEAGYGMSSRTLVLWVADSVCYDLVRLSAQGRSPAYAVRVVWNETLGDLNSGDAAAFGAVFSAATAYLCPDMAPYGEDVAYWLGF